MENKYIHSVCPCGCSVLTVPQSLSIDQLMVRCVVNPQQMSLKVTIKKDPLYGWKKAINL